MKGDKLTTLIEKEMNRYASDSTGMPTEKLTWQEYKEDVKNLKKPTDEQIKALMKEIQEDSIIARIAETGWKIVPFLSARLVGEETANKGSLTYVILDNDGNIVHAEGSGKVAEILPKELLENAAEIEIEKIGDIELRLDTVVISQKRSLGEALKNCC